MKHSVTFTFDDETNRSGFSHSQDIDMAASAVAVVMRAHPLALFIVSAAMCAFVERFMNESPKNVEFLGDIAVAAKKVHHEQLGNDN